MVFVILNSVTITAINFILESNAVCDVRESSLSVSLSVDLNAIVYGRPTWSNSHLLQLSDRPGCAFVDIIRSGLAISIRFVA